jgi:hypothetical protein
LERLAETQACGETSRGTRRGVGEEYRGRRGGSYKVVAAAGEAPGLVRAIGGA